MTRRSRSNAFDLFVLIVCIISCLSLPHAARAAYPEKPIRLIVPFGAGGSTDIVARLVATRLGAHYGKAVVVENLGGGNGIAGTEVAARSPADGYTIMMGVFAHALMQSLYKNLPFSLDKDFDPLIEIGKTPQVLEVNPTLPVKNVAEFISYLKANPAKLNYGAGGVGTASHVTAEMFLGMTHTSAEHIQYRSGGLALNDLMGGRLQFMIDSVFTSLPLVQAGKLRALAVTSAQRSAIAPDLPTVAESGVPGFESSIWYGYFVPAGTPKSIVNKLNADIAAILKEPSVRDALLKQGLEVVAESPAAFGKVVATEVAKWKTVIDTNHIKSEN